jgi:hypothetical protein
VRWMTRRAISGRPWTAGPGEWTQTWDGESGEYYYYNALTRETMWEAPEVGTLGYTCRP